MTATDVLRRLLDERGVEWGNILSDGSESDYLTEWQFDGIEGHAIATEWSVGHLTVCIVHPMTPEQAIAATLGRGTCRIVKTWSDSDYVDGWRYRCSECGCFIPVNERDPETGDVISAANYCPNCGRRCVG